MLDIPKLPRNNIKCRFGCDTPEGLYHVPSGCVCWSDPVQALCKQHEYTIETDGGEVTMIAKFTPELEWK